MCVNHLLLRVFCLGNKVKIKLKNTLTDPLYYYRPTRRLLRAAAAFTAAAERGGAGCRLIPA